MKVADNVSHLLSCQTVHTPLWTSKKHPLYPAFFYQMFKFYYDIIFLMSHHAIRLWLIDTVLSLYMGASLWRKVG